MLKIFGKTQKNKSKRVCLILSTNQEIFFKVITKRAQEQASRMICTLFFKLLKFLKGTLIKKAIRSYKMTIFKRILFLNLMNFLFILNLAKTLTKIKSNSIQNLNIKLQTERFRTILKLELRGNLILDLNQNLLKIKKNLQ